MYGMYIKKFMLCMYEYKYMEKSLLKGYNLLNMRNEQNSYSNLDMYMKLGQAGTTSNETVNNMQ